MHFRKSEFVFPVGPAFYQFTLNDRVTFETGMCFLLDLRCFKLGEALHSSEMDKQLSILSLFPLRLFCRDGKEWEPCEVRQKGDML